MGASIVNTIASNFRSLDNAVPQHLASNPLGTTRLLAANCFSQEFSANNTRKTNGERLRLYIMLQVRTAYRSISCSAHRPLFFLRLLYDWRLSCSLLYEHSSNGLSIPHAQTTDVSLPALMHGNVVTGSHAGMEDSMDPRNGDTHSASCSRVFGATPGRK